MVHRSAQNRLGTDRHRKGLKLPAAICREYPILEEAMRYSNSSRTPRQATGNEPAPGFTLIEMLIVIAITAILVAVAVPEFSRYQDKAKLTSSTALLAAVRTDMEVYREKSGAYPASINFTDFTDQDGKQVIVALSIESLREKMYSWDSYTGGTDTFTIRSKAIDSDHTVLTLSQAGLVP